MSEPCISKIPIFGVSDSRTCVSDHEISPRCHEDSQAKQVLAKMNGKDERRVTNPAFTGGR